VSDEDIDLSPQVVPVDFRGDLGQNAVELVTLSVAFHEAIPTHKNKSLVQEVVFYAMKPETMLDVAHATPSI